MTCTLFLFLYEDITKTFLSLDKHTESINPFINHQNNKLWKLKRTDH